MIIRRRAKNSNQNQPRHSRHHGSVTVTAHSRVNPEPPPAVRPTVWQDEAQCGSGRRVDPARRDGSLFNYGGMPFSALARRLLSFSPHRSIHRHRLRSFPTFYEDAL